MKLEGLSITDFLDAVGAKTPTPGGGAVASVTAAIGAALGRMVLNYSIGRKSMMEHDGLHRRTLKTLDDFATEALQLSEADARAYGRLNELFKLPDDDPRRVREWEAAVHGAIAAPLDALRLCGRILQAIQGVSQTSNRMLASDLAIAAILAEAGQRAAAWNVRVNLPLLGNPDKRTELEAEITTALTEGQAIAAAVEATAGERASE